MFLLLENSCVKKNYFCILAMGYGVKGKACVKISVSLLYHHRPTPHPPSLFVFLSYYIRIRCICFARHVLPDFICGNTLIYVKSILIKGENSCRLGSITLYTWESPANRALFFRTLKKTKTQKHHSKIEIARRSPISRVGSRAHDLRFRRKISFSFWISKIIFFQKPEKPDIRNS